MAMVKSKELKLLLDEVLQLDGRAHGFAPETPLLGHLPELDSMAVVALITALEQRFGIRFDDDEVSADAFATLGSLQRLVESKLAPAPDTHARGAVR
jgi:acyl carrier protein